MGTGSENVDVTYAGGCTKTVQYAADMAPTISFEPNPSGAGRRIISRTWSRNGKTRPESPYSCTRTNATAMYGTQHVWAPASGGNPGYFSTIRQGYFGGYPVLSKSFNSNVLERAKMKALLSFQDSGPNVAVALGEAQKTISMVADRLIGLARFGSKTLQRWRRTRKGLYALDNLWLEYRYGWSPLMSDVYSGMEMLARSVRSPIVCSRGRASEEVPFYNLQAPGRSIYSRQTGKAVSKASYKLWGTLNSPGLSTAHALGLTNPLYVAWELVPFSFVADWVCPIGDALQSLDATAGYSFVKGSYTTLFSFEANEHYQTYTDYGGGSWQREVFDASRVDLQMSRVKLTGFPWGALPTFKNPLSVGHAANAVALVSQTFRAFRR